MLALAWLRCVKTGGSGARYFANPLLAFLVFLLNAWWEAILAKVITAELQEIYNLNSAL